MKKMLITIATVGVLAVPAGMVLAQSDPVDTDTTVPTCVDHDRDRERDRGADHDMLGTHEQLRTQQRTQLHDGDCDADCTGDQAQNRVRTHEQVRLDDGTGVRVGAREMTNVRNR
jgi:Ni/Co efflux regulator RcnB